MPALALEGACLTDSTLKKKNAPSFLFKVWVAYYMK